jgi:hypothetical protein
VPKTQPKCLSDRARVPTTTAHCSHCTTIFRPTCATKEGPILGTPPRRGLSSSHAPNLSHRQPQGASPPSCHHPLLLPRASHLVQPAQASEIPHHHLHKHLGGLPLPSGTHVTTLTHRTLPPLSFPSGQLELVWRATHGEPLTSPCPKTSPRLAMSL